MHKNITYSFSAEKFTSTILQEVDVPIISNDECRKRLQEANFPQFSKIPDDIMFCAGYKEGGKDACQVSSGIIRVGRMA